MTDQPRNPKLWKRLGWFALLWVGGVLAITIFAWIIRAVMPEF